MNSKCFTISLLALLLTTPVFSLGNQQAEVTEIYEVTELTGAQIYYASHMKPEALKDYKKIDDEDRAAITGAIGKSGIAMPRLKVPHIDSTTRAQNSTLRILAIKDQNGIDREVGENEYQGGKDEMVLLKNSDTISFVLSADGVFVLYTIHLNVTFPNGEKLVTMQTTRNRPLGVSTTTVSGKARRTK